VFLLLATSSLVAGLLITPAAAQPTPTIYYVPQSGSTWVNSGAAGASYNAYVSTPDLFRTQSNGYPYWGTMGQSDFVSIPAGSATNNQNAVSWEIGFHYAGLTGQRFQKIWDKAYGAYMIEIDTYKGANEGYLTVYRATTGGSGARWYIPMDTVIRAGHNYYVQIAWDSRAGPGNEPYPAIWIGEDGNAPVRQTHWDETGGALNGAGSWFNDAVGPASLGNTATATGVAWFNGGFFVYRQYDSVVDFSNGGSWSTDKLAWTSTTQATIAPTPTQTPKVTPIAEPAVTPIAEPAVKPVVKATPTPVKLSAPTAARVAETTVLAKSPVKLSAKPTSKSVATTTTTPPTKAFTSVQVSNSNSVPENNSPPGIIVPSAQASDVVSVPSQTVPEFPVLGLGIPALLAGAIYLLRRR